MVCSSLALRTEAESAGVNGGRFCLAQGDALQASAELLILARDAGSAIVGNEDVRHHQLGCN